MCVPSGALVVFFFLFCFRFFLFILCLPFGCCFVLVSLQYLFERLGLLIVIQPVVIPFLLAHTRKHVAFLLHYFVPLMHHLTYFEFGP